MVAIALDSPQYTGELEAKGLTTMFIPIIQTLIIRLG